MISKVDSEAHLKIPPLRELGEDLTHITRHQRFLTLGVPFLCFGAYFGCAALGWWAGAVLAVMALSFVTYGSTSHDLVHRYLGLPSAWNHLMLCLVELLALRSGHAYQAVHLYHHARYPHSDDIEARAARMTWLGAIAEGLVFQLRIWVWALRTNRRARPWIVGEGIACLSLVGLAVALCPRTPVFLVYVVLMVMGSWLIPLVTSYTPHKPDAKGELFQTRAFRGVVLSVVALEHLYHLEHHLYPSVPHQNWPKLAKRLDPFFERAGVKPVKLWF
jgi:beta-carotene hydroxylase